MATNLQNPNALGAAAKPANSGTKVDQYVGKQLKKTTQQVRMSDMVAGFLTLAAYVLGFFLAVAIVDAWIWPLSNSGRLLALAVFLTGLFGIAWFYLLPFLFRKINPQYAAKMIEEAKPEFKNSLLNYLSIRRDKKSTHRAILSEVSRRAATDLSSVSPDAMVDKSNVIRTGFVLVGLVAAVIGYSIFSPKSPLPTVMRVLAPGAKISKPAAVRIDEVTPGDASVFFGDRPEVTATVYGVGPEDEVRLVYSTKDSQIVDASIVMEPSTTSGANGSYRAILSPGPTGVQQPLVYRIEAGDGISPTFGIEVRPNPSISIESITVTPPSYTGLPERTIEGNGEIQAVEGSHVEIAAKSNLPIEIAYIVPLIAKSDEPENSEFREMRTIQMQADDTQAIGRLVAALNANRDRQQFTHYKINFRSTNNYRNERPNIYPIRVIADLAPEVEIVEPGATELTIPVNQPLPVEIWAADLDYEISSIDLHIEHQGSRILNQNLIKNPADKSAGERISVRHVITPQDLRLKPGDTAIMFASAADNRISPSSELPDPNVSRTPNYTLIVTDPIENPKPNPQNQEELQQDPQQRQDPSEQEQSNNSTTNQQQQDSDQSPEEQQQGAEQGRDDSGDAEEQNSGSDESEQQQSGSGSQQQGNSGSEQAASDQSGGEQSQQSQSSGEQADSESSGNESASDQNESQSGNSGESSRAESGSNGQQSREGNAGEFQNSDSSEQGAEASSNSGTENGTANDAANSSNGQRGANQNQRGSGDQEFRDESLTDGEVEPLPENAPEGDQFERLQKFFEENENQSQQSRSPNSANNSGDENGDQNSQENSGNRNEAADDGQPSNEGGRPSSPDEGQSQPSDPASENSSAQPNASDRSDPNQSGGDSQSGNQPEQQNTGENAADGNPEQPANNGAESQNGTPDPNQSGSGSRSQPDSQGDQSANPGESGSPDAQSTPGAGSESQGGSGEQSDSNSEQSQGSGEQSGNSEAGSQESQDAQNSQAPGDQSNSNASSESGSSESGNSESPQQPSDSSSNNSNSESGQSGESSQSGNSDSQSGQSSSQSGQSNWDQQSNSSDSNKSGESANSNPSNSSSNQDPTKFGGVGGAGEESPDNSGPDGPSQADKPNLDYAKKVTDLVLDQLEDQKYEPDQKLLDQMNWTKEDLAQFLKRWQQMRDKAGSGDVRSKREYENGLNSLGIFPESKSRVAKGVQDKEFRLNESGVVDQVPAEYVDRFKSFLIRRNRSKRK